MGTYVAALFLLAGHTLSFSEQAEEHAVIKPIPKSFLENSSEHKNYAYEFPYYDDKNRVIDFMPVNGTLWKFSYHIFGKDNRRVDGVYSSSEIIRTYRKLALETGGQILWEKAEGGRLVFTFPCPDESKLWCQVFARNGFYELDIVQPQENAATK